MAADDDDDATFVHLRAVGREEKAFLECWCFTFSSESITFPSFAFLPLQISLPSRLDDNHPFSKVLNA